MSALMGQLVRNIWSQYDCEAHCSIECGKPMMWIKLFKEIFELKFGLSILAIGILALIWLLFFTGDQLDETWPPLLYTTAYVAIPGGLLICLVGMALNLVDRRSNR
jgi:hypothetical protein